MRRIDRLPLRLRLVEAPLNGIEDIRRDLGALDSGGIQMLFKVKRNLGCEKRLIRVRAIAAQSHQHNDESEKNHTF
jgi:hypothetical protein